MGLLEIRFNAENAFIGDITQESYDIVNTGVDADKRAVLHRTFLASPLIRKSEGYQEIKFSGALQVGENRSIAGMAIDAFAHHVVLDSLRTCVLVDLQGNNPLSYVLYVLYKLSDVVTLGFVSNDCLEIILFDPQALT